MNQAELINTIAADIDNTGTSKAAIKFVLDTQAKVVQAELKSGGEVTLPGLGKFSTAQRAARTGHNPATGKPVQIAAKRVPKFSAAKVLKDAVV